ncbi:transmembrane protein, putative [Medicago truncatula]|uniref:Transmembrane protein, putative n=1 Tax=Medicago truncatula TaxID=3880 RepID=G7KBP0_MEDTR|nr:transmembrane protein, putative [Medicago truncatula]
MIFRKNVIKYDKTWNPFGVGLVVGLGSWSLLLQRSQVRFLLGGLSPYRACSGFKRGPRKWSVGLVPSD